ncbi:MAG TPA: hypothetical protein VM031_05990 [Phycisphaerae bacterium]|nr:hypothetical protein [Phycisphaerae bacterium]
MAFTKQEMEWIEQAIKAGSREGAFEALKLSEEDRKRMMREEARGEIQEHRDDCPYPIELRAEMANIRSELKISHLRFIIYLILAGAFGGGGGGLVTYIMAAVRHIP